MRDLRIVVDTDIPEYVRHSTELLDGSRVYRFSRELVAFLETMVAFSPYQVANDPNAAGPSDIFYEAALANYKKVPYDTFHKFIEDGLVDWFKRFPFTAADAATSEEDKEDANGEDEGDLEVSGVSSAAEAVVFNTIRKAAEAAAPSRPSARPRSMCPPWGSG